ncbi:sugar ABC transporter permease [Streptomyces sp. DSM 42041]|uniref:Xylose transport system permease protein XylH n=1 Tax=Streptomyces hazeniae TaxID=3075538 RepID=A0ABU2NRC2_9ACTN|nr:sugar ABC transporter permease [Streptomyces sp. DSM 42041]MDT0379524.1 sugar ABC transporter permease [Streptomyces sp. DSM 42041]
MSRPGTTIKGWVEGYQTRIAGGELGFVPALIGLVVIWIVCQSLNANFLSARNLSNLGVDIVGTGLIAAGIVFVLLVGEIDLSVGSVSGLGAALFAVLNVQQGVPEWLAFLSAALCGAAIGLVHGFFIAKVGVPAFVVTLAGLLAWNGLMLFVLGRSGTVNIDDEGMVAMLTSTYFEEVAAAYALAAVGTGLYFLGAWLDRRRRVAVGLPLRPLNEVLVRTGLLAAVAFAAAYVLNMFQGLPLALLILVVVLALMDFVVRRTGYGRRVLALGGGIEAARRVGVRVSTVRISVFVVSSTMASLGGLMLASRITSASQTSGSGTLLINAIAAAVIGGTSLYGGHGTPWSALLGMLVIQSVASGMALLGIQGSVQFMVTGGVLLAAVVVDSLSRRSQQVHGRA